MPYARAPSRSVTAATSDGARRASPGATIRDEAARHEGASYGTAALAAGTTRLAGAALRGHRRVRGPPIGRLPSNGAGAPAVQHGPVASGDRKSIVHGKRVDVGGSQIIKKKNEHQNE